MLKGRYEAGFTLLEILLVMVLLSLTAVVVVPTFPKQSNDDAKQEAERFYQLIQLWSEESLLSSKVMGVRVEKEGYSLLELSGNEWRNAPKKRRIATEVEMPDGVNLEVEVEGLIEQEDQLFSRESLFDEMDFNETEEEEKLDPPQVVMMGNGELFAFNLIFSVENEKLWQVKGSDIGMFELSPFDEDRE